MPMHARTPLPPRGTIIQKNRFNHTNFCYFRDQHNPQICYLIMVQPMSEQDKNEMVQILNKMVHLKSPILEICWFSSSSEKRVTQTHQGSIDWRSSEHCICNWLARTNRQNWVHNFPCKSDLCRTMLPDCLETLSSTLCQISVLKEAIG